MKKTKTTIATFALVLTLTIAATLVTLPITNAHDPPWEIPTYAYISVAPTTIGVDQTVFLVFWLYRAPPTAAGIGGDRWHDFTITVTKPNGDTANLGPFTSDPTGSTFTQYTPDQVGEYVFDFYYSGQVLGLNHPETGVPGVNSPYIGDTFLPSSASTTLTVQEDQIEKMPDYPLPSSYWTRPIEGQNTLWASIASNWVGEDLFQRGRFQEDGLAPNSPHIMWTKPFEFGGVVGGSNTAISGVTFYIGMSYERRLGDGIILHGRFYFKAPLGNDAASGPYTCVDLRTGETLWQVEDISPNFGQLYDYESLNQHGVIQNGILFDPAGSTWRAYDPFTGVHLYNLTNVPSGTEVYTPYGEIDVYGLSYSERELYCWTTAALPDSPLVLTPGTGTNAYQYRPIGKNADMSNNYKWNVTIPDLPGSSNPSIVYVIPDDLVLGRSSLVSTTSQWRGTPDPWTMWAISLKPETRGQLLWIKDYPAPAGNITQMLSYHTVDSVNRVFTMTYFETGERLGYSLDNGELLWGPVGTPYSEAHAYQYFSSRAGQVAYGNLYVGGYGGEVFAYSMKNGTFLWNFNNTESGVETPWGLYPNFPSVIADGKIYSFAGEHSPNVPPYKGERVWCIDAFSGDEIWSLMAWSGSGIGEAFANAYIADGFLVYENHYDNQLYCIGKGPSATTVTAPDNWIPLGSNVMIRGTVTDQCAGAKRKVESGEFSVVPAMSDESMGSWMEHIYMQKPMPEDAKGVTVKLTAIYPNGNTHDIGEATTDLNGNFGKSWEPPVPGDYRIIAEFAGTESYWQSSASTYMTVDQALESYPEAPSAAEVAQETINRLPAYPDVPSAGDVAQETINQLPAYPEPTVVPEYTAIDLVIIALVVVGIVVELYAIIRKQK